MLRTAVAVYAGSWSSVAWTVNDAPPVAAEGVPLIVPEVERAKPWGRTPPTTVHEYGASPPVADRSDE